VQTDLNVENVVGRDCDKNDQKLGDAETCYEIRESPDVLRVDFSYFNWVHLFIPETDGGIAI